MEDGLAHLAGPELRAERAERRGASRFAFECEQRWSTLEPTDGAGVRHCSECQSRVHWCESEVEVAEHARCGECVTVSSALLFQAAQAHQPEAVMGRPNPIYYWGRAILEE